MNAWTAWVGWLRGGGKVGPARGGSNLTTQFIYYLERGRLGEIYSYNLPPSPSTYTIFASKDMLQNYFLIRTYENVNKEEE